MSIRGGPLKYTSNAKPYPLSEEEEAVLAFAACGITGPALGDWEYTKETLGNSFANFTGRTISSPDAVNTVSVFVINNKSTWLARRPQDLSPKDLNAVIDLGQKGEFVEAWKRMRIKISDKRIVPSSDLPYNVPPNQWSLYAEGTTYFLPVYEQTQLMLNVMLGGFEEDMGIYFLDDKNYFLPAGIRKYAKSKGGHLKDDPNDKLMLAMSFFERTAAEMCSVEQGMILQNLGLACQAMGLAGFPHNSQLHPSTWFEALGFRMEEMPTSKYLSVPWPMSWLMKLKGADLPFRYPVGLEIDDNVLLKGYCPPYYESMEDAVRSLIAEKFGYDGIYSSKPDIYKNGAPGSGWKDPEGVTDKVSEVSELAVQTAVDHCEYVWKKHGRFPSNFPPFHTSVGFQVGHVDEEFYDRFYKPGTLDNTHRQHMEQWHPDSK